MTRPDRAHRGPSRAYGRVVASWPVAVCLICCGPDCEAIGAPDGIAGQVVDRAGRGVASAKVWVLGGSWEEPEAVADATADGQGKFGFPDFWGRQAREGGEGRNRHYVGLFARDGDGRVGWATSWRNDPTASRIELFEKGEARGRLVDRGGRPIADAGIAPVIFIRWSAKASASDHVRLGPEFSRPFATRTAADGSFALRGIPEGTQVQAQLAAPGFGSPRVTWDSSRPVTIALDGRTGRIEGRAASPDGKAPTGKLKLSLRRADALNEGAVGAFSLLYLKTGEIGEDGAFRFEELPPGRYEITVQVPPDVPYQADSPTTVVVDPGANVSGLALTLKRLLTIEGRVVDAQSGQGIAGVNLGASFLSGRSRQYAGRAETDEQGRYRVHVPPGKLTLQPDSTPKTHLGLRFEDCPQFDVAADRDWPDLRLAKAAALDGIVVDVEGRPVADAEVHLVKPDVLGIGMDEAPARTDPAGAFRLEGLDPDDTLPVRARTKAAATDGAVVVRPRDRNGRLSLTIDPKGSTRVRGVVKDRAGKPVAGAAVSLWWGRDYVSEKTQLSGLGSVLEGYTTDEGGRFASAALWPGDRYKVTVQAKGYGRAESPEVTGRAGDDRDLGTIVLVGTGGHVAGKVVDTDGRAVAGADVFNRGDATAAVAARTGDDGTFRLDGLFVGGKYAFARKAGHRFAGVRVAGEADDLTIVLRRDDEPPPPWTPQDAATPDEQKELAKRILNRLWERYGHEPNKNGAFVCMFHMARIDPGLALLWSAQGGGKSNARIYAEAAEARAETDAGAALEMLAASGGRTTQYVAQRLAERFAGRDREKALRFAEEAAAQALALEQPDRAGAMARAGAVLAKLGRKDVGLPLIREAAEAAERMGAEGREAYARGNVAGALAPFDLPRALALVEPIGAPNGRDRYLGFVASAIAATDPARAVAIADRMDDGSSTPQTIKIAAAHAIGAERPDEAVAIIEGMKGYGVPKHQAEAFGWLAVAVAPRDPKRAEALIDRALALPVDQPQGFESWTYFGGGAGSAAWIAACAKRAGYPDMAGAVARVLASRPAGAHHDPSMQIQSLTIAAAALALTDPGAARRVLRDVEDRSGLGAAELSRVAGDRWLTAWALADPKHAEDLFEREFAALEGRIDVDLQRTGLLKMAEILAVPPLRREEFLRGAIGATWYPGRPD